MTHNKAYAALAAHLKTTGALEQVAGIMSWDQEVMMPKKGDAQRAEQMGALEQVLHARRKDERIGEWLAEIDSAKLDTAARVNVAEAQKTFLRARRVPSDLAEALARKTAAAMGIWAQARKDSDFAGFAPVLDEILTLKRREAEARHDGEDELYDVLLDDYEPGQTGASIAATLGRLRDGLVNLRENIGASGKVVKPLTGLFDPDAQMALGHEIARVFGYDFEAGRLDKSVHPFSSGSNGDSRITTRVNSKNPFDCLYSVIHETGHAVYEQNMPTLHAMMPAGFYASMGVHESQSRLFENQIGRSREFCHYLFDRFSTAFGDHGLDAEAFYATVNRVHPGFIRTESDEVFYNLHVLMRFDLERAMINGSLEVNDLKAAWNDRFAADFGQKVDCAANGVLQDVHWSLGLFGYFPTYALGNVYAACLFEAMQAAVPNTKTNISNGLLAEPIGWLTENIHQHGRLLPPVELITQACGQAPDERPLLAYLNIKFGDIYGF
ncbi:MAG: carboxypeptidase M32 [Paracoccaceae bacterium]